MKIEVFKTNVQWPNEANRIVTSLTKELSNAKINFDLEDCDKILRIEGTNKYKNKYIMTYLNRLGYSCEILD